MDYVLMGKRDARRLGLVEAALEGRISNQEGADALGISRRQFKRLRCRARREGPSGLVHRSRGRASPRRLPERVRRRVVELLAEGSVRLNDCHLADLLAEDGVEVSAASVRRIRLSLSVPAKQRRRPPRHHRRRQREARSGALVQIDGSPFAWLGESGPVFTLHGAIDDASGEVLGLSFRSQEDLHGYALVLRQVFTTYGLPLAIYGDRTGIFVRNDRHWTLEEELAGRQHPTQMGQVLEELGIGYIAAHSPQAKGRIERLWGTLQDRLAAELQLRGIDTVEAAEAYLPEFRLRHNARFALPPRETRSAWRRPPRHLDRVLACRYRRVVARDNTVSISGRSAQIPAGPYHRSYHGCRVEVRELLDGRLLLFHQGRLLAEQPAPEQPFVLCPRPSPRALRIGATKTDIHRSPRNADRPGPRVKGQDVKPSQHRQQRTTRTPASDHPWRRRLPINLNPTPDD